MAASALSQMRVARVDEGEVELVGPSGAIGVFRARIDDVSRALSGAMGRRVRAVLAAESGGVEDAQGGQPDRVSLTMDEARAHPLVAAAQRAFNADIQRVDAIPKRRVPDRPAPDRTVPDRFTQDQSNPTEFNP
jgi:hypothetical protein